MSKAQRANPDSRNFGLKNRDMARAGMNALREGMQSHSSINTMSDRWRQFSDFAREKLGLRDMRCIEKSHLEQYAVSLIAQIKAGELAPSTAQNYLSAVNRVLEIARGDRAVRLDPVREAGLPKRSGICVVSKAVSTESHHRAQAAISDRLSTLLGIQRELGLRFAESAKIDAVRALAQAEKNGGVRIQDGTKGGRARVVPITHSEQLTALKAAADLQNNHRSLIPIGQTYASFRAEAYREIEKTEISFHGERHHYAQVRYQTLVGAACPVVAGIPHKQHHSALSRELGISIKEARALDHSARLQISAELGHGRIEITNSYLG